jgi:2,5-diketo-D-gluconate reductase A
MTPDTTTAGGQVRTLADGNDVPTLGLGVWQVPNGPECVNVVRWALELGYRHIDTAQAYGNEESVGRALRESGMPREDVFITTKFYPGGRDPAAEAERSLNGLDSTTSTCTSSTGPQVGRPGHGRAWSALGSSATRGPSACPTSTPASCVR